VNNGTYSRWAPHCRNPATYQRRNQRQKDGIVLALLAAEITARMGLDPGEIYRELTREFGEPLYDRVKAATATPEQKEC